MKRKLTAAVLVRGTAVFVLVWGCPSVSPPGPGCAGENEACTTTDDCCDGLTCSDGVCIMPTACASAGETCTDADDCCEALECVGGTCGPPPSGTQAAIPAKQIELDLIGIHDPNSDAYSDNCIGCHGDRTDEVALDGVTPAAHATMAGLFGEGNDRCIACHGGGPNFFGFATGAGSFSAGALREQVDMEEVDCAVCHGPNAAVALYAE